MRLSSRTFGQVKVEAPKEVKIRLSQQAKTLVSHSQTATGTALIALESAARAILAELDQYQSFEDSSYFEFGSWDSSQTIRANLQATISNIRVKTGIKEGAIHGQQKDVSVAEEFTSNVFSQQTANEIAKKAGEMLNSGGGALDKGSDVLNWLIKYKTWLLVVVTMAVAAYLINSGADIAKMLPFINKK